MVHLPRLNPFPGTVVNRRMTAKRLRFSAVTEQEIGRALRNMEDPHRPTSEVAMFLFV
jgi:DNA topoisomerase IA